VTTNLRLRMISILLPAALLASCGGSSADVRSLVAQDVEGQATGNAKGTVFAGTYVVDTASIDGCRCRAGSCSGFHTQPGATFKVQEQDGSFTINSCHGGINDDGTFWCGGVLNQPGVVQINLNSGQIVLVAGKPSRADVATEMTMVQTIDGVHYDCDVKTHGTARFLVP
jgi:hypothetical protein